LPRAWTLYLQAKEWGRAPSQALGITNTYEAFCLDEAIWWFGNYVEKAVAKAAESTGKKDTDKKRAMRAEREFQKLLGLEPERSQFATAQPTITVKAGSDG